jgi:hypothetical protein
MGLSGKTGICEYLGGGEYAADHEHLYSERSGNMRLSANTGICESLTGEEYEAERERWYLRASEKRGM